MQTTVSPLQILILASGTNQGAENNAKGHLFEQFIARLMQLFGYEAPTRENLNATSNGIELDITATHTLTKQRMIAECKAYTSPVQTKQLAAFYGKLASERFENPDLFGFFVAVPGLTAEGREQAEKLKKNDKAFAGYSTDSLIELLLEKGEIHPINLVMSSHAILRGPVSDEALIVTEHGLYYAVKELSNESRLPTRVLAYPSKQGGSVPSVVADLLSTASNYNQGFPCEIAPSLGQNISGAPPPPEDAIFEVTGSSSDFEYQFPAAPKYFVGRQTYLNDMVLLLDKFNSKDDDRAKIIVLNAQSGWGKSSLALRLVELANAASGSGICIDCRTATHPTFVPRAIRHALMAAQQAGVVLLPADASFASVASTIETLRRSIYMSTTRPVCIFFDQFENVFQNAVLTREFRDFALGVTELHIPLVVGFGWKTDFVAFTESYPYQLRDDIRSRSSTFTLAPFGPHELGELLQRLKKSCGQKIHPYLRERIREYSQGLPWLFKKLGSHIIREIKAGATQNELLSEVLNIQGLFDADISSLNTQEQQALRAIARRAPMFVTEAADLASGDREAIQSLLNQRLLVSIGDKLDVYWDVFRDYLNQGAVPLLESYILRLTPAGVSKLLIQINNAGGSTTPDVVAQELTTSVITVLNMARDLRQLGILAAQEGVLKFSDDVGAAADLNEAIRARAAVALRRHRVYSLLTSLAEASGRVSTSQFAVALPKAYPAVDAKPHTWVTYARAFSHWFQFAGLLTIDNDDLVIGQDPVGTLDLLIPGKKRASKGMTVFPRVPPEPVLRLLRGIAGGAGFIRNKKNTKALGEANFLNLVRGNSSGNFSLTQIGESIINASVEERPALIRNAIKEFQSFQIAEALLDADPGTAPLSIGQAIGARMGLDWSEATAMSVGKYMRAWMRAVGVKTTLRSR